MDFISNTESEELKQSRALLAKLDTYTYSTSEDYKKEEIGFCSKCNKMIAMKYTGCSSCPKHFCKTHREAHQCEFSNNNGNCLRIKLLEGKNSFMDKLKLAKIKAGGK